MIINSIYIEGIQSIVNPIKIDLSPGVTRIAGRNTAGKSAITKSLSLFAGVYSRNEIIGLVSRKRQRGKESVVGLFLEDGTTLWAIIRDTSRVQYQRRDGTGTIIQVWDAWEEEIIRILGWQTIEKEKLCLNIKKSKVNLFIDTSPRTNGEIMDYLCRDNDMEIRIANLEESEEKLKSAVKISKIKIDHYTKRYKDTPPINLDAVERLYKKIGNIQFTRDIHHKLQNILEYRDAEIREGEIKVLGSYFKLYKLIKTMKDCGELGHKLNIYDTLNDNLKVYKYCRIQEARGEVKEKSTVIEKVWDKVKDLNTMVKADVLVNENEKLMGINLDIVQVVEKHLYMYNNIKRLSYLIKYEEKLENLYYKNDTIQEIEINMKNLNNLKTSNNLILYKTINMEKGLQISNIQEMLDKGREMRIIKGHRKMIVDGEEIRNKEQKLELVENKIEFIRVIRELGKIGTHRKIISEYEIVLDQMYEVLQSNSICPLCKGDIDVDKMRGEEHCHNL